VVEHTYKIFLAERCYRWRCGHLAKTTQVLVAVLKGPVVAYIAKVKLKATGAEQVMLGEAEGGQQSPAGGKSGFLGLPCDYPCL
jgi:hypothetical protein